MVERPIGDSSQDIGTTTQFTGSVGTTSAAVPSVAGDFITSAIIRCPNQTPTSRTLSWSVDDITFHVLAVGEFIGLSIKGNKTQIYLKGSVASVDYEVTLNREPT
jgi:hypothetical protein